MFWYGAQTYFASQAVALLITGITGNEGTVMFLGMTGVMWVSFIFVSLFQVYLFWQGIDLIKRFLNFAGPAVYIVMIFLMLAIWTKAGGGLLSEVGEIFSGGERSKDFEGERVFRVWGGKLATRVAEALWSVGELAIRKRHNFQRIFDLTERVIPSDVLRRTVTEAEALDELLLCVLSAQGWVSTGTMAATWRLVNKRPLIESSLSRLVEQGLVVECLLNTKDKDLTGWIRPSDIELAQKLERARPRRDKGVLLSPFDPLLSDRGRTRRLFDFNQLLEIYKPRHQRQYGYYCLPVLAGDRLIARVDLRAFRKTGNLSVLSRQFEAAPDARQRKAVESALKRFARSVGLHCDSPIS